jgi:hypothetical protein
MGGVITAAVVVAGASMYVADQANNSADQRAADANAANTQAADRSRKLAEADDKKRRAELLRRFNIKADKTVDTNKVINQATATKLTNFEMQLASAQSVTDNALATKHITGRLAERLNNAQSIQASMAKGTIIQGAESQHMDVGDNLEMMRMNYESENLNLDIDLSNAINQANNQEVRGYTYSTSTGTAGVIASGVGGAESGASAGLAAGLTVPS